MSQCLLTITVESFRNQVTLVNFDYLKTLLFEIYEVKRNTYKKHTAESPIVLDLERKETIIWGELQRRGINLKGSDFIDWMRKMQNKSDKIFVSVNKK
jgi:hypothetical protein